MNRHLAPLLLLSTFTWLLCAGTAVAARTDGSLTITTVDELTGKPLAVRMELRDRRGRPVRVRGEGIVSRDGYLVFDGQATLRLRKGDYTFLIEAGPEYQTRPGRFTLERHAEDSKEVTLLRRVNMREEGWWAADLDVRLPAGEIALLSRAASIDFVPRPPLLLLHPAPPKNIRPKKAANRPLADDHAADAIVVAATPTDWDFPLWIASNKLDAIATLDRSAAFQRGSANKKNQGRPRDKTFFPGKMGAGRYREAIYHHVLNCGLRIPPAAGSGAGANGNPIGANRVYAHCGEDFSDEQWLKNFRAGRVMVTNGPLLRTKVSGQQPGHVFQLERGETREFRIALSLTFYELSPVEYLEIVKNGRVLHEIRLDELAQRKGRLPPMPFDESGWFLVRARTSRADVYQYASTGPYYVEANYERRISRGSVQYFLDWLQKATEKFADDPATIAKIQAALPFWQEKLKQANTD